MHRVSLDGMTSRMGPAAVSYPLTDELGASNLALNYYELAPGDSFAFGFHAHADQEEIFYIQGGTVTFRTEAGDVEVGPDELARFGPGEFQRGVNEGEERVVALAMGAPQDAGETEILRECGPCGEVATMDLELTDDHDAVLVRCTACGSEVDRYTD